MWRFSSMCKRSSWTRIACFQDRRPGESFYAFSKRVDSECRPNLPGLISKNTSQSTKKWVSSSLSFGHQDVSSSRLRSYRERQKQKQQQKKKAKQADLDEERFLNRTEAPKFGEVASAPPEISFVPRRKKSSNVSMHSSVWSHYVVSIRCIAYNIAFGLYHHPVDACYREWYQWTGAEEPTSSRSSAWPYPWQASCRLQNLQTWTQSPPSPKDVVSCMNSGMRDPIRLCSRWKGELRAKYLPVKIPKSYYEKKT